MHWVAPFTTTKVNDSDKILKVESLLKESMNFQDKDACIDDRINEFVKELDRETNNITTEVLISELDEGSKEAANTIADSTARKT